MMPKQLGPYMQWLIPLITGAISGGSVAMYRLNTIESVVARDVANLEASKEIRQKIQLDQERLKTRQDAYEDRLKAAEQSMHEIQMHLLKDLEIHSQQANVLEQLANRQGLPIRRVPGRTP
jgi:hypothetical protein